MDYFRDQVARAGGGSYQTAINAVLREYLEGKQNALRSKISCGKQSAKNNLTARGRSHSLTVVAP